MVHTIALHCDDYRFAAPVECTLSHCQTWFAEVYHRECDAEFFIVILFIRATTVSVLVPQSEATDAVDQIYK